MRLIDADALIEILTTAIRNMQGVAKFIGAEDDPEIKMEIKAYSDILNGVKGQPTIEPQHKKGKWIEYDNSHCECPFCHEEWSYFDNETEHFNYCPNCGADMRKDGATNADVES